MSEAERIHRLRQSVCSRHLAADLLRHQPYVHAEAGVVPVAAGAQAWQRWAPSGAGSQAGPVEGQLAQLLVARQGHTVAADRATGTVDEDHGMAVAAAGGDADGGRVGHDGRPQAMWRESASAIWLS